MKRALNLFILNNIKFCLFSIKLQTKINVRPFVVHRIFFQRLALFMMILVTYKIIHLLQALKMQIFQQFCSSWQDFIWHSASRGISAMPEFLVDRNYHLT